MSEQVAIHHVIEQRFDRPVRLSTHWLRLRPAPQTRANITAYSIVVHEPSHFLNWLRDPFENQLARLDLPEPITSLRIELELIAELKPINPFDFLTEPYAAQHPFAYPAQLSKELGPYLHMPTLGPRMQAWLKRLELAETSTIERLNHLNQQVRAAHAPGAPRKLGFVDLDAVFERGSATFWERAWLLTLALRHAGFAARFASGHRLQLCEGDVPDLASMHAWAEAYLPGAGWIGLDPDAGLFCNECYIPFAAAPDPIRALPIAGYIEACEETQVETLSAHRLRPATPSWPHSETQWRDIRALGVLVEQDLQRQLLQPALAASLSLVSSPAQAPEWTISALGPSKLLAAEALLERLQPRLAPGSVIQLGQSEWYAGEALPRWRLACFARADGLPIWRDPQRLAWRSANALGRPAARDFAYALARALGVDADVVTPAYEDALHDRLQARFDGDVEPQPADLRDPERRRALAEQLSLGRDEPTGYVLPIRPAATSGGFHGGRWEFRRGRLYLLPGDSSIGFRLPLGSLVADELAAIEAGLERDPFEERAPLPGRRTAPQAPNGSSGSSGSRGPAPRTALCVEWRAGRLCVFLPPCARLEDYLTLMAAVEASAEALDLAVALEGYEPPEDPRLRRMLLEPDAGVLRLTLPETLAWREHVELLQAAYAEAARSGLHAERVLPEDEQRIASGPSHLLVGGPRPVESPFLTRPQILASLIRTWQRHPSLSYLFAGRQIGPSGASPRPDEGRDEALYELSIALEHLDDDTGIAPLWKPDRVLRHLLTDPSGNLKRAELRVDQLYPPDRASLRLGRVQISAFDTAPDERLAALQSLLVLGLLGRFAQQPQRAPLERWGTDLHDRFMLPAVLEADLRNVLDELNSAGYPFQWEWFEPLTAQRFPVLGTVQIGSIGVELRAAHEPWPLLAEEVTGWGVARFIDAANERVQVRLSGMAPARYTLTCNEQYVPLQRMAADGDSVAGVRFKASNPPATLHPTLPPVEALVFDLIDTWTGQVIGGFTYYPKRRQAWWPGGYAAAIASPPVSSGPLAGTPPLPLPPISVPAVGRRGRFVPHGRGGARIAPPPTHRAEAPYLLDLTR